MPDDSSDNPDLSNVPTGGSESTGGMPDSPSPVAQPPDDKNPDRGERGAPIQQPITDEEVHAKDNEQFTKILNKASELQKQSKQKADEYDRRMSPMYAEMEKQIAQPLPQMPMPTAYQQQPDYQENRRHMGKAAMGFLAVAIPLAIAFGARGGGYSAGAMGGLAQGINNVIHGYDDQFKESMASFQQHNQMIHQEYEDRLNTYKQILNDRGMKLNQKMGLIDIVAKQYHDGQLARDAQSGQYEKMLSNLENKEKLLKDHGKQTQKATNNLYSAMQKDKDWTDYRIFIQGKYGYDPGDESHPENMQKAWKDFSYAKFKDKLKNEGKAITPGAETGKLDEGGDKSGDLDSAIDQMFKK
jgi:hypothetical protein